MNDAQEPNVGSRIRELRQNRGLSLRALAQRCDLSINAISRIERGVSSPTLSSLHQLATALGVAITDFFQEEGQESAVLVRGDQRQCFRGKGLTMDSLGSGLAGQELEPFMVTVEPGAGDVADPVTHSGFEFVYCIDGVVEYAVADQLYQLSPRDSLILDATQPHTFKNNGEKPATFLLIFQADGGGHLARRRHLEASPRPDIDTD